MDVDTHCVQCGFVFKTSFRVVSTCTHCGLKYQLELTENPKLVSVKVYEKEKRNIDFRLVPYNVLVQPEKRFE